MNRKKIIPRLLVSPFVLGLIIMSYIISAIVRWFHFIRYGGEWINYDKNERKHIQDVYSIVKDEMIKERFPHNVGGPKGMKGRKYIKGEVTMTSKDWEEHEDMVYKNILKKANQDAIKINNVDYISGTDPIEE